MRRGGGPLRRRPRGVAQQRLEAVGGVATRGLGGRGEGREAGGGLRGADDGRARGQVVEVVLFLQALEGVDVGAVLDAEAAVNGGHGAGAGDGQARVVEVLARGLRDDGQAGDEGGDDLGRRGRDVGSTVPAAAGLAVAVSVAVVVVVAVAVAVAVVVVVVVVL